MHFFLYGATHSASLNISFTAGISFKTGQEKYPMNSERE